MLPKKPKRALTRAMCVLLLISLTSCAKSIEAVTPQLDDAPQGLRQCTEEQVPDLPGAPGTALDKAQSAKAIGDQRTSAKAKDRCAHSWQSFYDELRVKLTGNTKNMEGANGKR